MDGGTQPALTWRLGHRPSLDALRGVAILLVLVAHAESGTPWHGAGLVGVGLFFALSGYLITGILLDQHDQGGWSFLRFYERRIRRLAPALIVYVGVMVGLGLATPEQSMSVLGYYANLAAPGGVYGQTWSLAFEEQFYLVWPLALLGLLRLRLARTALAVALAVLLAITGAVWFAMILAGAAVAIGARDAGRDPRVPAVAAAAGAVLIGMAAFIDGPRSAPLVFVAAPLVVAWVAARPSRSWRPLERVGRISYGMYLWHYPFALAMVGLALPWPARFGLLLAVSLLLAGASWVLVERRFLVPQKRVDDPDDRRETVVDRTVPLVVSERHELGL